MMADMSFNYAAARAADDVAKLVVSKQKDYGPKNILNCPIGAELGIAVRLNDKISRLVNLVQSGKTGENESLIDTANDIMGYGLVLKMILEKTFEFPLVEEAEDY